MGAATMTLIGLNNYSPDLFSNMVLPDGIDKDLFIASLLLKSGEFEVLYPDPVFMQQSIGIWSMKWYRTFAEWLKGTQATWNPIYNYDRFEDASDNGGRTYGHKTTADYADSRTANLTDKRTADLQDKRIANLEEKNSVNMQDRRTPNLTETTTLNTKDTTAQTVDGKTVHQVSAYDTNGYIPSSRDDVNNGTSEVSHSGSTGVLTRGTDTTQKTGTETLATTGTDTNTTTGTDTTTHTGSDTTRHQGTLSDETGSETNSNTHKAHIYGNIGVTQSADMLRNFYDIATWNLYDHMSDVFASELLIPVY